jgi:hypothetical protein
MPTQDYQNMIGPNLFIVGHPKSGTTALHAFLSEHPQALMSNPKEPWFFCRDFHAESDAFHKQRLFFPYRDLDAYLKLFSSVREESIVGEASVFYLRSEIAAQLIHEFNPDAKIIIMLREPVAFLESLHKELFRNAMEGEKDFARALALEAHRRRGERVPSRVVCPSWVFYSEWIKYAEHIGRYFSRFAPSQIKVILAEDFRNDNDGVYREVLDFLGISDEYTPDFRPVNARGRVSITKIGQMVFNPVLRKHARRLLPYSIYSLGIALTQRVFWKDDPDQSTISDQLSRELREQFVPEVNRTSEVLGVDLAVKWGYRQ